MRTFKEKRESIGYAETNMLYNQAHRMSEHIVSINSTNVLIEFKEKLKGLGVELPSANRELISPSVRCGAVSLIDLLVTDKYYIEKINILRQELSEHDILLPYSEYADLNLKMFASYIFVYAILQFDEFYMQRTQLIGELREHYEKPEVKVSKELIADSMDNLNDLVIKEDIDTLHYLANKGSKEFEEANVRAEKKKAHYGEPTLDKEPILYFDTANASAEPNIGCPWLKEELKMHGIRWEQKTEVKVANKPFNLLATIEEANRNEVAVSFYFGLTANLSFVAVTKNGKVRPSNIKGFSEEEYNEQNVCEHIIESVKRLTE